MKIENVREFVQENLIKNKGVALQENDDWLANGLVDSIGIIQIVSFVEREFKTAVPEEDVTVDNFKSLKDVAKYLERRKLSRGQSA
jgi:acyl carrier protein